MTRNSTDTTTQQESRVSVQYQQADALPNGSDIYTEGGGDAAVKHVMLFKDVSGFHITQTSLDAIERERIRQRIMRLLQQSR